MKNIIIMLSLLYASPAFAEEATPVIDEPLPAELYTNTYDEFFTFTLENDLFGGGTDNNYTNGLLLTYYDRGFSAPGIARWLGDMLPTFDVNETTSTYYSLGHNLYTPDVIITPVPDSNDRPYAAYLYASAGFTSRTDDHLDDVEATIGVLGPLAMGEEIQSSVHKVVDGRNPRGWDSQLENELGLGVSWQRSWPDYYTRDMGADYFLRAIPHAGITLGNVYSYANTGFTVQFMPEEQKWQSQPLRVRPAIPGNGLFTTGDGEWTWMAFAGAESRLMGRNIFLDGNTFEDSASVDKNYLVADATAGVAFAYGRARVSYTMNYRTKEFEDQDNDQLFGVVSLSYRF